MNIQKMLQAFNVNNVRYIVTGVERNTPPSSMQRVIVEIEPTPLNALKVLAALKITGLTKIGVTLSDIFDSRELAVNLANEAVGARVSLGNHFFEQKWLKKQEVKIGDVHIYVAGSFDLKAALENTHPPGYIRLYSVHDETAGG